MTIDRLQMIKNAVLKGQKAKAQKKASALEMRKLCRAMDARKIEIKKSQRKATPIKVAKVNENLGQKGSSLDCFKEENMYYSERNTASYLEGSSYMETYNSMKNDNEWN